MTQAVRQDNLFASENWQAVYQSFRNADFKAYDFDTLRTAMIDYIRLSYPEDFNDWIQSSEFVALIDLIAFLGQNLAFRVDLNSRENFIDTAERRESILRLARFVNYNPKRNIAASGLLKVKAIKTTEPVYDPYGLDLSNKMVQWVNVNDPDNYEKFITILNAALNPDHKFGNPVKTGSVGGVVAQQYALTNIPGDIVTVSYSANTGGKEDNFEICNTDFLDLGFFKEATPNPYGAFNLVYRNDNAGNTSPNTGLFVLFKQGKLIKQDFNIVDYVENRVVDIDIPNVNEADVYVQSISADGSVVEDWSKVPNVSGNSVIYNSYARGVRKVYSVITRQDDKISIKFGDGLFSEVPVGLIRVWVRTSNAQAYTIKPSDMKNITWDVGYYDAQGRQQYLTLVADLEYTVNNSSPAESLTSIKANAPLAYTTQDRMVTASDYTVYPLTQSADVLKVKAVNRVHSGFSRYTDPLDPTGTYQNIDMLSDDFYIYKQTDTAADVFKTSNQLYVNDILDTLQKHLTRGGAVNLYYANYSALDFASQGITWNNVSTVAGMSTGYFTVNSQIVAVGTNEQLSNRKQLHVGALVEFTVNGATEWAAINSVSLKGLGLDNASGISTGLKVNGEGAITISKNIPTGATITRVIPALKKKFDQKERADILSNLGNKFNFGIRYNYLTQSYVIVTDDNVNSTDFFSLSNQGDTSGQNKDASWIYYISFADGQYLVRQKLLKYIIGSNKKIKFGNINFLENAKDSLTSFKADVVKFLKINTVPSGNTVIGKPVEFSVASYFVSADGYTDTSKVIVKVADSDNNYLPDNPYTFEELVGNTKVNVAITNASGIIQTTVTESTSGTLAGRTDLIGQWKHYAESNQRIDPAVVNIIDLFILSSNYDTDFRRWMKNDGRLVNKPLPPTTVSLSQQFADLELVKTSSDTIVFRPAKYKLLFGALADQELQARFKVVKMAGTSLTDNEIRSKVIAAIDSFFDIRNWTFGETFYFTEMAAYIHTQLAGSISSIVIVPTNGSSQFGKLFQVGSNADELFVSCATVADIEIISQITDTNIRIGK